jgi:hypothetical protein
VIEPSEVELKTRTKGSSKRRPNLSYEELNALAVQAGVSDLYEHAVVAFEAALQKQTTRSSIRFVGSFDASRKAVINLLPGESNAEEGLRYQRYSNRFAELAKIPSADVEGLMPRRREEWVFWEKGGPDWEGFQGFITGGEEIDRLAGALRVKNPEGMSPAERGRQTRRQVAEPDSTGS